MSRMRKRDVPTKSITNNIGYLYCNKRRNKPRVSLEVCNKCKYKTKCLSFKSFKETMD